ncbi:MAG: hypothetical protein LAT82_02375 [Nanoarchaeota archaeon]|nr:hypothetical protein [Nanoarchaeota archaeon]
MELFIKPNKMHLLRGGEALVYSSKPYNITPSNAMRVSNSLEGAITQSRINRNDVLIIPEFDFDRIRTKYNEKGGRQNSIKIDELRIRGILSHDLLGVSSDLITRINPLIDGFPNDFEETRIISQNRTRRSPGFEYLLISSQDQELFEKYIRTKGNNDFFTY